MLTAATAALLSGGHAEAATCDSTSTTGNCNISTAITSPVYTGAPASGVTGAQGNLGNITINTNGSIIIGTSPPVAPVVTLNSGTTAAPTLVTNNTTIQYTGVSYAVGALLQESAVPTSSTTTGAAENWVGELFNSGSGIINLTGAGTNKNGILIAGGAFPGTGAVTNANTGVYANQGLGVFTGANFEPTGTAVPVAIDLATGSTLEVQGTSSFGINLIGPTVTSGVPAGGASLIGDIDVGGTIVMTPTTVGSTTPTGNVAVNLAGWMQPTAGALNPALQAMGISCSCSMVGSFNVTSGGTISAEGAGAEGVVVLGGINGAITNAGQISTFGTTTPSTALNANDPEAGSALVIANNVTGGIFNAGPTAGGSAASATRATISMVGTAETIDIASAFNPVPVPITIGGFTDTAGYKFSLLSRGTISASAEDANLSATDILAVGQNQAAINLPFGIFNSGVMTANTVTNSAGPTSFATVTATTIDIGNFVTVGTGGALGATSLPGGPYALVNANETGSGSIQASVAGAQTGTAIAIHIEAARAGGTAGSLPSIFNSGTISAAASTTNLDSTGIAAYAILDESGTLTNIYNTGTISATTTTLNNNAQIAVAIDTATASAPVTITDISTASNSADIIGNIIFGSGNGTLSVTGTSGFPALVSGNIVFTNATATPDALTIGQFATVSGQIAELNSGAVNIDIAQTGTLDLLTSQPTNLNSTVSQAATPNKPLNVNTLTVAPGALLNISLSQGNNAAAFPTKNVTVINAQSANIGGNGITPTIGLTFGGFVGTPSATGASSQFVLISTPGGALTISPQELTLLTATFDSTGSSTVNSTNGVPFLFTSNICTIGVAAATGTQVCASAPNNASNVAGNSELVLTLTPKPATGPGGLGLTGFAAKMFPFANQALVNDNTLGAAMVNSIVDQPTAQAAYAAFAPDVSGATRATAISLTDSSTNVVAARQRALRMYANTEGDTTLWGQQFVQRLSANNSALLTGYNDSGFGFVLGADQGDAADGRYGAAFTFFTGGMSQKEPTSAKTSSEYYMLTGYSDWRGKGFFLDTQATAGYGNLKGRRFIRLTDPSTNTTVSREAEGNRATEFLAGSVTSGVVLTAGGSVITPQVDLDGLTGREEAYTESGGGQGFDLHVQPYYMNSLRAFIGTDLRQDFNFGDFYLQPELRFGYRYDFVDGAQKLKANFASVNSLNGQTFTPFTITGLDPDRGNLVLGGGLATTTGAWSIGLSYDYVRGGSGVAEQSGVLSLVGRI
jgi:hypothetical protein